MEQVIRQDVATYRYHRISGAIVVFGGLAAILNIARFTAQSDIVLRCADVVFILFGIQYGVVMYGVGRGRLPGPSGRAGVALAAAINAAIWAAASMVFLTSLPYCLALMSWMYAKVQHLLHLGDVSYRDALVVTTATLANGLGGSHKQFMQAGIAFAATGFPFILVIELLLVSSRRLEFMHALQGKVAPAILIRVPTFMRLEGGTVTRVVYVLGGAVLYLATYVTVTRIVH